MSDRLQNGFKSVLVSGLVIGATVQTVEQIIFTVMPVTPLAFVLVQAKSFIIVPLCNKQLFEVRKAVQFPAVQRVRVHPVNGSS